MSAHSSFDRPRNHRPTARASSRMTLPRVLELATIAEATGDPTALINAVRAYAEAEASERLFAEMSAS